MRHLRNLSHSLAAGALAGGVFAPMQFLCWPEVRPEAGRALVALAAWSSWGAAWLGGLFFIVQEGAWLVAPGGSRVHTGAALWRRFAITVGMVVAAVAWWNNAQTRELLVPANRQAITTAGWVALAFAIVLALPFGQRAPRRHPLLGPLVATTVLLGAVWSIWIACPPPPPPELPAQVNRLAATRRLLFVAWEGTDLPWLLPAMERGDMPFLHGLWSRGAWGQVRTIRPYARSAALATLLTGCAPSMHGVLGKRSYILPWLDDRPVTLLLAGPWPSPHQLPWRAWQRTAGPSSRRATIGDILQSAGLRYGLSGWPPPLEGGDWVVPLPLAAEVPPFETLEPDLRAAIDPALRTRPEMVGETQRAFAVAAEIGRRAARCFAARPIEVLVADNNLASRVRPPWSSDDPASVTEDVLRQAARLLDVELAGMWRLVGGDDTLLVLSSPYGLAPASPWRRLGNLVVGSDRWRVTADESPDGFVFFFGPGVQSGARIRGARLADVTPTALYLLDMPVARDMAGRVLLDAVDPDRAASTPLRQVASFPVPPGH